MATKETAYIVGKWAIGFNHETMSSIVKCEWKDRSPIVLMFRERDAVAMAQAILNQHARPPPAPDRLS